MKTNLIPYCSLTIFSMHSQYFLLFSSQFWWKIGWKTLPGHNTTFSQKNSQVELSVNLIFKRCSNSPLHSSLSLLGRNKIAKSTQAVSQLKHNRNHEVNVRVSSWVPPLWDYSLFEKLNQRIWLTVKSTHKCVKASDDATAIVPRAACTAHRYRDKAFAIPSELIIRDMWSIYPSSCSKLNFAQNFSSALASPAQNWPCTASRNFKHRQFQGHHNDRGKA